jgi:predicted dehydrogenase
MTQEIRLGITGYGQRGRSLARLAVDGFANVRVVGVCDVSHTALDQATSEFPDATKFDNFDAMLNSVMMDALLVETPATLHAEFCSKALLRDINVMGDVPAVESVEQAQTLWDAQQRSNAFYMIGANPNTWGFVEAAEDLIRRGLIGKPYLVEAEYVHDIRSLFEITPWRKTYESIRYCTHSLGPVLRWIKEDLVSVACFDTGSHVNQQPGQHDAMVALFRTSSNVVVRMLTTFINNVPTWGHRYRIYGTAGYFERTPAYEDDDSARTLFYSTDLVTNKRLTELPIHQARPEYLKSEMRSKVIGGHGGADYALFDRFFAAIRSGGPSPIDVREALAMTLPGLYAAESARRGGELVNITYPWSDK